VPYNDNGRNAMLTGGLGNVVTHVSLHYDVPGAAGANELSGGGYARQPVTWAAAAAGVRDNTAQLAFTVDAGTTAAFTGLWGALTGGTFYGYAPLGAYLAGAALAADAGDVLTSVAHGLSSGNRVMLFPVGGAALPAGLVDTVLYHVVNPTADTFQVSLTSGGAAEAITAGGEVAFQRVQPETFGAAGTLTFPIGSVDLSANFV
jgi:hypothetical protein